MDYQQVGDRIVCGEARFSALSDGLVRVEWSSPGQFEDRPTVQVMTRPEPIAFKTIAFTEGVLKLETESIAIAYRPDALPFNDDNLQIQWRCGDRAGTWVPSTIDPDNLGGTFTCLDVIHRNSIPKGVHPASVYHSYPNTEESLYAPLKAIHRYLRDRGETTEFEQPPLWYIDQYRRDEIPAELAQFLKDWHHFPPGLLSRSGYSVLNDTSAPVDAGNLSYRSDPGNLDWYFFAYGVNYPQALQDFVTLCGRIPMLPRWAFGVWFSQYEQMRDRDYRELVGQFDEQHLPLDVVLLDVDWHLWGWCGWDWNPEFFPNPSEFLDWAHRVGLHIGANIHLEGVPPEDSHFKPLCEARGLDPTQVKAGKVFPVKNPTADWFFKPWQADLAPSEAQQHPERDEGWLLFNLAQPEEARQFIEGLHVPREEDGIDFWWIDGRNATHPGANSQLWTNHVFYTHLEAKCDRRPLILSRTGGIGSHRYPIQFSADTYSHWEVLAFLVDFTARSGNVGIAYWSHDLGGFFNHALGVPLIDPELFVRWVQFGCWSPIVRLHSDHGRREPWVYGRWVLEAIRKALQTRRQIVPYLYHLSRVAYDTGLPLCRPLYLCYQEDPEAYDKPTQYMLGDSVLVAPVLEPGGFRAIDLPGGQWWERETNELYCGPVHLDRYVALDRVPVFVKAGTILPLQDVSRRVGTIPPDLLILEVYSGASGELDFYEDDGESLDYKNGGSWRRFIQTSEEDRQVLSCEPIRGEYRRMPERRSFKIRWIGLSGDRAVEAIAVEIGDRRWDGRVLELTLPDVPQSASWQVSIW